MRPRLAGGVPLLFGLASFSVSALQGALLLLLNFSVSAGGGFLVRSFLQRCTVSTDITRLGGVMQSMPLLSGFFLLFGLVGIGLPGTSGFPGELMIIARHCTAMPALASWRCSAWCSLLPRERACLLLLAILILAVGVYPLPVLELLRPPAEVCVAVLAGL